MKHTILIVEDDPLNRKLLSELLALKGYRILEVHDGKEGVAQAIAQMPELILMDIHMPGLDGIAARGVVDVDNDIPSLFEEHRQGPHRATGPGKTME